MRHIEASVEDDMETTLDKTDEVRTDTSVEMGVFWPTQIYEKWEGKKPPANLITTLEHNRTVYKGVAGSKILGT
eukprot:5813413-Pyramimonas_sp.AAC.1